MDSLSKRRHFENFIDGIRSRLTSYRCEIVEMSHLRIVGWYGESVYFFGSLWLVTSTERWEEG